MNDMNKLGGGPAAVPVIDAAGIRVITQKRFSTRTRFEFGPTEFAYRLDTDGSSRSYRMDYADLSSDRETLVDRNSWWRNVGLLWVAIGVISAMLSYAEQQVLRVPIWFWLGIACYGVYHFRVIRYLIVPTERCNVLIIDDASGAEVVRELESRRAAQLRERYDYIAIDQHPEQQRNRIQWLGRQGVLDAHEVSARLLQLDAMVGANALAADQRAQDDE